MGRYHAQKFARLPGVQVSAVVDADLARAQAVSNHALSDYRAIFGQADAAGIAGPTDRHHAIARDCLQHGLHLLMEKPIAATLAEADELIALAAARRLVLHARE